jgi:hypothetical protein
MFIAPTSSAGVAASSSASMLDMLALELGTTADDDGATDILALDESATTADDDGVADILALDEAATTAEDDDAIGILALDE